MFGTFDDIVYERICLDPIPDEVQRLAGVILAPKSADDLLRAYRALDRWVAHLTTAVTVCQIRHTVNTADEFYAAEKDYYDNHLPAAEELFARISLALAASPYQEEIVSLIGPVSLKSKVMAAKAISAEILPELQKENALVSEYERLCAGAQIQLDGKTLNLMQLAPYKVSTDRDTRKRGLVAEGQWFADNAETLDRIFDDLVKVRTAMAKKLGFKDFADMAYCRRTRNCYDRDMVANFRRQIAEDVAPIVSGLLEKQYARVGITDPKAWDRDLVFKSGNPAPKGTPEEIFAAGKKMYSALSPLTGEFFDFMTEHGLFDVLAKPGKAPGGYCASLPDYKAPFVFASFNGTQDDIEVLTHECGHALEDYVAARRYDLGDLREYTYDIAEIHSMTMEFMTYPWMDLFFGEDTEKYYFAHLFGTLKFLPYGCLVDHFQHSVYENPEWTADERNAEWNRLMGIYMPDADFCGVPRYEQGARWQRQIHIYEVPFYYIDYCLAQYAALWFWSEMQKDAEAAKAAYFSLVEKAGTRDYVTLLKETGIPSPFESGSVKAIADAASTFLDSIGIQ